MNRRDLLAASAAGAIVLALPAAGCAPTEKKPVPVPPAAKKDPVTIEQVGRTRVDEFQWMKDADWQKVMRDPSVLRADIRAHLEAENTYMQAMMDGTDALQTKIFEEIKGRIKEDDSSVPDADGPFEYYVRYALGAQHPVHARKPRGQEGPEQVLLDVDAMAKGKAFYRVGAADHAPDHSVYVYAVDDQGSEVWKVYVRDVATGQDLPEPIEDCYGSFVVSPDSQHIFWTKRDDNGRPSAVYRRPLRGGKGSDVLVYEEPDDGFFVGPSVTESRQFILIGCGNQETSEIHVIPAATPTAKPRLFAPRVVGELYSPTHFDGRWYILTNQGGAVDFKVMTAEVGRTDRKAWKDFLPHQPGRYIEGMAAFENFLVRQERVNALPRIVVRDRVSGAEHAIEQAEQAYTVGLDGGYEYATTVMRYTYTSPTTPRQWFDYDMATKAKTLRKTQEVPSGHDPSAYVTQRFTAKAADGADVPVTVLMRADVKLDGAAPLLLYGYGSYGSIEDAEFSVRNRSLVDRGWVFAIAHVRGGADKGRGWFEDGRKAKKVNTFDDFIAVAQDLVAKGYTRAGRIVSYGGSAGGLLVGAVANRAPDGLFGGHIAAVPFVDVLNTMSDVSLPLTPPEWPEWGNPLESATDYDTIAAYCPYSNVADKPYPPILATGGLSDPRVTYWEPAKWVARLRDRAPKAGPFLLYINMDAGHGGASGRFDRLKEVARDYAFAMRALGEKEAGGFAKA